jgi:hypothetical protein
MVFKKNKLDLDWIVEYLFDSFKKSISLPKCFKSPKPTGGYFILINSKSLKLEVFFILELFKNKIPNVKIMLKSQRTLKG